MGNPVLNHKMVISRCPFCGKELVISRLSCQGCNTQIESKLTIPSFFRLPLDLQDFALTFLRCRGSIRDVEKELGISYPTVCKRLDMVNQLLGNQSAPPSEMRYWSKLNVAKSPPPRRLNCLKEDKNDSRPDVCICRFFCRHWLYHTVAFHLESFEDIEAWRFFVG